MSLTRLTYPKLGVPEIGGSSWAGIGKKSEVSKGLFMLPAAWVEEEDFFFLKSFVGDWRAWKLRNLESLKAWRRGRELEESESLKALKISELR